MVSTEKIEAKQKVSTFKLLAIDDSVGGDVSSPVEKQIERLILWAYETLGTEQLVKAKEQFYWKTGKVFVDDQFFEGRIGYFIDHFLFERPIELKCPFQGETPYAAYTRHVSPLSLEPLGHSIFRVTKSTVKSLNIKSLIDDGKYSVVARPSERLDGISKGDIFQCYLYKLEECLYLSKGIIFHPFKAYKVIRTKVRKAIAEEDFQVDTLLHKLARQQLRQCRHVHVEPKKFYLDDSI